MNRSLSLMRTFPAIHGAVAVAVVSLGIAGCASQDWSKEPLAVSVSAANYSEHSRAEIYLAVNDAMAVNPVPPAPPVPTEPVFYGFVPGEIYDSDVPLETVYRELAVPLAHRGYFNVVYQVQAGLLPKRVDYLLRIHCGVRRWATPTVRVDDVTWGNSGLISNIRDPRSAAALLWGARMNPDPRAGGDPTDTVNLAMFLQTHGSTAAPESGSFVTQESSLNTGENFSNGALARDYCLVVVEAFKFEDVWKKKNGAPCIWATFIAVPLHTGQQFSAMLPTMARTAMPYFGTTTSGLQMHVVPPGKVILGEPVAVPGPQLAPQPRAQP